MLKNKNKGFTLIELIMVTIILGILAVVAAPKFLSTVCKASEAVEREVVSKMEAGLETFAMEQLALNGRRSWPSNPFDALDVTPDEYIGEFQFSPGWMENMEDDTWFFVDFNMRFGPVNWPDGTSSYISGYFGHQRRDNSRWLWYYDKGVQEGDVTETGSIKYTGYWMGGTPQEVIYEDADPNVAMYNLWNSNR